MRFVARTARAAPTTSRQQLRQRPHHRPGGTCAGRSQGPASGARGRRRGDASAEETNRLNRERRSSGVADRRELARMRKKIAAIEDSGSTRALMDRLRKPEAKQDESTERLSAMPADLPDIHPQRRRHLPAQGGTDLGGPEKPTGARRGIIRDLTERITLWLGPKHGQMNATLHDGLGTILESTTCAGGKNGTGAFALQMSVSVEAGTGLHTAGKSPAVGSPVAALGSRQTLDEGI